MEINIAAMENPLQPSVPIPQLAGRFVCLALVLAAATSGAPLLEWMSLPVLFLMLVVVWGRHVAFLENLHALPRLLAEEDSHNPALSLAPVSLIVSARNEEMGIEAAVRSLAALDYPDLEIIVIDDHSSDATPQILRRLTAELPQVRVLLAPAVPRGWTGKSHALWFGFKQSDPAARWLLFTDARVMFHKHAVRRAVTHAEANGSRFLSCVIRLYGASLAEECVAVIQTRGAIANARSFGGGPPAVPFGVGAFSLIRRDLYDASGGHSRFPANAIEDTMLAKLAQCYGEIPAVAIASDLVSLRRYNGFADMRQRVVRSVRLSTSDRFPYMAGRIGLETLLSLLPLPVAMGALLRQAASHHIQPALAVITLLAFLTYIAGTCSPRRCRSICQCRSIVVWLHPAGAALWVWLLLLAIAEKLRGKGISWRGRIVQSPTLGPGQPRMAPHAPSAGTESV